MILCRFNPRVLRRCRRLSLLTSAAVAIACAKPTEPPPTDVPWPSRGISGLWVTPTSATLSVGDSFRLRAIVTPANAPRDTVVIWTSSRPAVALIDSLTGMIRTVAPGWATLTATFRANVNFKAGAQITVEK